MRRIALLALAPLLLAACRGGDKPADTDAAFVATPLQVPSPAQGPLLERLTPEATGINFQNTLPLENTGQFLYVGAGAAAGDYDGDGLPDIYLVSETGANRLYRNLGGWRFEDVTATAGVDVPRMGQPGRWAQRFPTGAVFFDSDNDSDLDLYVTAFAGSSTLFQNNGDGTFTDVTAASGAAHVGASTTTAVGDYDRDGDLDLYVAAYRPYALSKVYPPGSATVQEPELNYDIETLLDGYNMIPEADPLFQNNGDGTFTNVAESAGVARRDWGLGAVFGDVNGDGWLDLYVANDFETPDRYYLNRRDGTFAEVPVQHLRHSPMFSMGADFGDVNNDGRLDLMTSDMLSPSHVRQLTQSIEMVQNPSVKPPEGSLPQVSRNCLFVNVGDAGDGVTSFVEVARMAGVAATDWTWTVKFADIDLDGLQDLLVTNGFVSDAMNSDEYAALGRLRNAGNMGVVFDAMRSRPRLLTPNVAFRNTGDLRFEDVSDAWGFNDTAVSNGMALADFDGDGDQDAVVNSMNAPAGVYRNNAAGKRIKVRLTGTISNRHGLGARITLDAGTSRQTREMSVGGGYMSGHEAIAVFGLGDAAAADRVVVEWPSGHRSELTQVAANQSVEIIEPEGPAKIPPPPPATAPQFAEVGAATGLTWRHEESAFDDFHEQPLLTLGLSRDGPGVAWGDADGDGKPDLAVTGAREKPGALFMNRGARFETVPLPAGGEALEDRGAAWWHDGTAVEGAPALPKLVLAQSAAEMREPAEAPVARVVEGGAAWTSTDLDTLSDSSGGPVALADVDADGDLDVFVGGRVHPGEYPRAATSTLLRNDAGRLVATEAPALADIGLVTSALWSDLDGDHDPDLALATDWGSPRVLRNQGGTLADTTADSGLAGLTGRWRALAAGDLDHDGDTDLVAVNLGRNTPYTATADAPATAYGGDLDTDGHYDYVEGTWAEGVLRATRNRMDTANTLAAVWTKYPTFGAFANAPLAEILTPEGLARATKFEAAHVEHVVLLNDGHAVFTAAPLPEAAQVLVGNGVSVADADGDGHDDIFLVGNFNATEPIHTGPLDGGVGMLLHGDGAGGFTAVEPRESGLWVPFEARGLAAADYDADGWVDFAVGINDGPPLLFHNGGTEGNAGLTVRLAGPPANPTGVGSRVTVRRADGLAITKEVRAGGGFLSQDDAALVFGLGATKEPARIEVTWPDGATQEAQGAPGQLVEVSRATTVP